MTIAENLMREVERRIEEYREKIRVGSGVPPDEVFDIITRLEELENVMFVAVKS